MTTEVLNLSCVPGDEPCAQVGKPDYEERSVKECQAYIRQLKRVLGDPPDGARLKLRYTPHNLGTYLTVVCEFDTNKPDAITYAFKCDDGLGKWDAEARAELGLVVVP